MITKDSELGTVVFGGLVERDAIYNLLCFLHTRRDDTVCLTSFPASSMPSFTLLVAAC